MRLGDEACWQLTLYPEAGEAGGSLLGRRRQTLPTGGPPDELRSLSESERRARAKVRRYCAANVLNRLGTLTYAEACFDPLAFRVHVAEFFRALRLDLGERFAYAWVPEWHPGGHGLHAHVAFGRFVARRAIERAWGRGFVQIKLIGNLPVGAGARGEARVVGRYLGKYVSKSFADGGRIPGLHRYDVAQGFQPRRLLIYGPTVDEAIAIASRYMGAVPSSVWLSSSVEGWRGPPACWAQWA